MVVGKVIRGEIGAGESQFGYYEIGAASESLQEEVEGTLGASTAFSIVTVSNSFAAVSNHARNM